MSEPWSETCLQHAGVAILAEELYVEACRSGERERRGWPVDEWFWLETASIKLKDAVVEAEGVGTWYRA